MSEKVDGLNGVRLRPATEEDLDFLVDLIVETNIERYRRHARWDEAAFRRGVREQSTDEVRGRVAHSTTYVVELDGEPVGRLRLERELYQIRIGGIQIGPEFQGRGLGTALIESVIQEASAAGGSVVLEVERDNPRAKQLYERLGFVTIADDPARFCMDRTPNRGEKT